MSLEYWTICVEEALGDAGVSATREQIEAIAKSVEWGATSFGEQHGHVEASKSLWSDQNRKIEQLQRDLRAEDEKIPCPECAGKWTTGLGGVRVPARDYCWTCDRSGKVAP